MVSSHRVIPDSKPSRGAWHKPSAPVTPPVGSSCGPLVSGAPVGYRSVVAPAAYRESSIANSRGTRSRNSSGQGRSAYRYYAVRESGHTSSYYSESSSSVLPAIICRLGPFWSPPYRSSGEGGQLRFSWHQLSRRSNVIIRIIAVEHQGVGLNDLGRCPRHGHGGSRHFHPEEAIPNILDNRPCGNGGIVKMNVSRLAVADIV